METKIVKRPDITVLFVRKTGLYEQSAPAAHIALRAFLEGKGLDPNAQQFYGIAHDDPDATEAEKVRFDSCVARPSQLHPEGEVGLKVIPGGSHAEFVHKGDLNRLGETYDYIYCQWFPNSGKKLADRPCVLEFPVFTNKGSTPMDELITRIYLPLQS